MADADYWLSTEANVNFRKEDKEILQSICSMIQERTLLKYSMIKYVCCFNPQIIWTQPEECLRRLNGVCNIFLYANRIATTAADKAKQSWNDLVSTEDFKVHSENYCKLSRSDPDIREHLLVKEEFNHLLNLVNAEADRGVSVDRQILQENMLERSMVAQRIVHQELTKAGGKITDVTIEKQMMTDVRLASRRRVQYLNSKSSKNRKKNRKLKERREKLRPSRNWKLRKGKLMKKLRKCCAALI